MTDVGIPLSGGVDSSIVAALAVRTFPRVNSYTASITGFDNPELPRAREVAERLGIPHRIVEVTDADVSRAYEPMVARIQEPPGITTTLRSAADGGNRTRLRIGRVGRLCRYTFWQRVALDDQQPCTPSPHVRQVSDVVSGRRGTIARQYTGRAWASCRAAGNTEPRSTDPGNRPGQPQRPSQSRAARPRARKISRHENWSSRHFEPGGSPFETFQSWHSRVFSRRFTVAMNASRVPMACTSGIRSRRHRRRLRDQPAVGPEVRRRRWLSKPILREICGRLVGSDVGMWSKLGFPSPERRGWRVHFARISTRAGHRRPDWFDCWTST